jgi:hypothetical protein
MSTTYTAPDNPADSDDRRDYHAGHAFWCANHDTEFTEHTDDEPYYPPLPPGADPEGSSEDWTTYEGVTSRLVWSWPMPLPEDLAYLNVQAVVTQLADGTIYTDQEAVFVGGHGYSLNDARRMAQAMTAAAELVDRWTGTGPMTAGEAHLLAERLTAAAVLIEAADELNSPAS